MSKEIAVLVGGRRVAWALAGFVALVVALNVALRVL